MNKIREMLPHLPALAAFVQTGQVTAAADVLGLPQPQISRSISRLEQLTGLELKSRQGRGVTPTRAAIELGSVTSQFLQQLTETLGGLASELHGTVSLSFQHSLGESLIPHLVKTFLEAHPSVGFTLTQGSRDECTAAVESGRSDIAFVAGVPDSLIFRSTVLYTEELVLAVPHDHELANHPEVTSGDIAGQDFIALRHGLGLRRTTDSLLGSWGIAPHVTFEGQEIGTVLGLVAAGLGIAIVPRRRYAHAVTLVPFTHKDALRQIIMATAKERLISAQSALFAEHAGSTAARIAG